LIAAAGEQLRQHPNFLECSGYAPQELIQDLDLILEILHDVVVSFFN